MKAVSNAGPLIHLSWIGELGLLDTLFDEVLVPEAVRSEVLRGNPTLPSVTELGDAFATGRLRVRSVARTADLSAILAELDPGESEAIVLARDTRTDALLIDERRGRAYAQRHSIPILGTIGILQLSRDLGLIPSVAPLLDLLRSRGFRVSSELMEQARQGDRP